MKTHTLAISGMNSDHCVRVVTNIISKQEGAEIASIQPGKATIRIDETKTSEEVVVAAIEKAGYTVDAQNSTVMETRQFKTTIKCSGCVGAATPFLNRAVGENNWAVDTGNPDKVLTVILSKGLEADAVIQAVEEAGYKAEALQ